MKLYYSRQTLVHQDDFSILFTYSTQYIKVIPSHLLQRFCWIDNVLKSKCIENTIKFIILERHFGHIANNISVLSHGQGFSHTDRSHVRTPVNHCDITQWFVKFQVPVWSSACLQDLHLKIQILCLCIALLTHFDNCWL